MYGQFEQLEGNPFASAHEGEVFVPIPGHREVLAELTYWLQEMDGVGMLTAGPGLGKTHLCRQLLKAANQNTLGILISHGHFQSVRELLQSVLYLCERPFEGKDAHELNLELLGLIRQLGREGRTMLLIVDDAHELEEELLLELRALTAPQVEPSPAIRLLLSGQLELEELLTRRSLAAINQSLTAHQILEPLTREESAAYLAGRLSAMNCDIETVLSEGAVESIVQVSDGVPRCLNQIAEASFRECADRNLDRVSAGCVAAAFEKVRHLPLHWNNLPEISSDSNIMSESELDAIPLSSDSDIFDSALDDSGVYLEDDLADIRASEPRGKTPSVNGSVEDASSAHSMETQNVADSANVEFVVAEFGSGMEEGTEEEAARQNRSRVHYSSPKLEYAEDGRNVANVRKTTLVGGPNNPNDRGSSDSMLELVSSAPQNEGLELSSVDQTNTTSHTKKPSGNRKNGMTQQNIISPVETRNTGSRYLRIDTNPIDIFAPDIPEPGDSSLRTEQQRANVPVNQPGGHVETIEEHVERLRQEAIRHWEPSDNNRNNQYDVIEPESIPAVPKARPSLELDLPNHHSKPRYRNLFRDLRRNRGE
jgi:type II secretory pathway predicted ATPase ExeA